MVLSVLLAAGIVAQVFVKINRLKLHHARHHVVPIVQNHAVLSQIRRLVGLIALSHAVQKQNN
ncbi:MAG TPA: hypothetical protein EYQ40_00180 [Candidatus Marinimicrobia bacterium]|jgi:hypothetical protein|nr:hypothetical protein [Candidatus Neomarinimicrobiota bacterium]